MSANFKTRLKRLENPQDWGSLLPPGLPPDTVINAFVGWILDEWPDSTPSWREIRQKFSELSQSGTLPEPLKTVTNQINGVENV